MPIRSYKFIDLFCGIGGFHRAMHSLGAYCVMSCDIDDNARKTYVENYKKVMPSLLESFPKDITQVDEKSIPSFDVLCAGFPCQPFSQAGHKKGFSDKGRGNLFFDIMRIVDSKRPKVLFLENVRHLVNHDGGKTFQRIQKEIEKRDYSFSWKIIKASDFNLPQHRARVYIVCFDKKSVLNYSDFVFPTPLPLTKTMSDIFAGKATRDIGFTLRCGGRGSPINDRRNWDGYMVDGLEKRLTSKEGKEMMGFPPSFVFPVSETAAMKQLGNSVAVPVVRAISQQIFKVLDDNHGNS